MSAQAHDVPVPKPRRRLSLVVPPTEAELVGAQVIALLERLASEDVTAPPGSYPSAEIHTVGPEAKVPYPEVP